MAAVTVAIAVSAGDSPVSSVSLSCRKVGELHDDAPVHLQCDDPLIHWVGVWPFVWLGLLLAAPLVVAALAMRVWVSWMAVNALAILSIVGLINWTGFWGQLLYAVPLAIAALVIVTVQYARTPPPVAVAP